MTDDERARLHRISARGGDLRRIYEWLGRSMDLFTERFFTSRSDECERFLAEHRDVRARAEDAAQAIEDEVRAANEGQSNDGPDQWTADLDRKNRP